MHNFRVEIRAEGRKISEGGRPVEPQRSAADANAALTLAGSGPEETLTKRKDADDGT